MKALHALHIAKDVGALEVALRAATVLDTRDMPALAAEIDLATTRLRALRPGSAALRAAAAPAAAPAATSSPSDDEEMPVGLPPPRARPPASASASAAAAAAAAAAPPRSSHAAAAGAAALAAAAPAAPSAAVAAGCFEFSAQPDGTVRVHVPRQHVGKLIGRGGANIAALRDKCKMALSVKKSEDGSGIVTLDGTREAIARARRAIDECFSEELRALEPSPRDAAGGGARGGGGGSGSAAERVVCMAAPLTANQVGRLIGQRGERIQALRQAYAPAAKIIVHDSTSAAAPSWLQPSSVGVRGSARAVRDACSASSNSSTSASSGRRSRRPKRRPPTSAPAPPRCRRRDRRRPPRRRRRRRPRSRATTSPSASPARRRRAPRRRPRVSGARSPAAAASPPPAPPAAAAPAPAPAVSDKEVFLAFANGTGSAVELLWVEPSGSEVSIAELPAGGEHRVRTYAGHRWRVRAADDGDRDPLTGERRLVFSCVAADHPEVQRALVLPSADLNAEIQAMAGGLPPPAAAGGFGGLRRRAAAAALAGCPRRGPAAAAARCGRRWTRCSLRRGRTTRRCRRELLCPITLTLMADPVTTVDGMTYERYAIETWLQANNTSPLTGEPLPVKLLVPNTALRSQIQRYREKHASPGGSRTPGRAPGRAPARNGGGRGY